MYEDYKIIAKVEQRTQISVFEHKRDNDIFFSDLSHFQFKMQFHFMYRKHDNKMKQHVVS